MARLFFLGREADTRRMYFTEHGGRATFYLHILRVAFIKERRLTANDGNLNQITCKTFIPVQLTSGLFVPEFESLLETKNRISAWITATGANIISAETLGLRLRTRETKCGMDTTFTYNRAETNEYWIFIIRLYINGRYQEPPNELLPPVPEIDDQNCCLIA